MNVLVLSDRHHLLPFARKLTNEGHTVATVVFESKKAKYERAYTGVIDLVTDSKDSSRTETIGQLKTLAASGDTVVISDSPRASKDFSTAQTIFSRVPQDEELIGPLRLGAWFDGESFHAEHLLIFDEGTQAGGLGSPQPGAVTLAQPSTGESSEALLKLVDHQRTELQDLGFRGLAQWGLDYGLDGALSLGIGRLLGWPPLHSHAFLSELEDFGGLLSGQMPVLGSKFAVAVHVTQAPWPYHTGQPLEECPIDIPDSAQRQFFWHDIRVDQEARELRTAGLDGWVGVAHAAANSFELALSKALDAAAMLQIREKQYRTDAGSAVRRALGLLENQSGLTFG